MLNETLKNHNVILIGALIFVIGIAISIITYNAFGKKIDEVDKEWNTTLKFNEENAEEFPYSVKTQQGNLYAEGPLYANSPLVTNDNVNGEWLAIKEYKEEYRMHTETHSCNCRRVNGHTRCSTCTRPVWSWEYDGTNYWKVDSLILLGQVLDAKMFNWEGGWFDGGYQHQDTKEGNYYLKRGSSHRSSFSAIPNGVFRQQGFSSTHEGFIAKDISPNKSDSIKTVRLVTTIILVVLTLAGTGVWIGYNYEQYDRFK